MKHLSSTVGFIRILILVGITHVSQPVHSSLVDKNDSLLNIISTSPNDTDKVIHYIKLCDWNNYSDSKQAIVYAQSAIAIAKKAGYHKGIAKGYERLGNAYFQLGDNRRAAENYLNARDANKKVGNYQLDASVYYNLGNIQHELGNYDSAIYYANEAGKIFKANNDSIGYGASLYLASGEYNTKGNYDQATAYILEALAIFRKKGVREWEVYALNHLVEIYNVQKKYDKSLELLNTCLDYHRTFNNAKFMAITYRFMGDIYIALENFEKARTVLDSSLYINDHYGFVQEKCKTMYSLGKLEFETGNYDKALKMYTEGLKLSFDLDDELFKCSNYLGIGQCLYEQKKYADAVDNLERSIIHAKQLEDIFKLRDGYLSLSQNYEALNEPDKALSNFKLFKQFSDSATYQENKRQFAELASKFETEKKEQQISELQKEKGTAQANNRRVVFLWILTIIVGLLIVSILIQAYWKNKQLLNKEKELDKVKSRFFSNISHEFRTPLTLILGPVRDMLQKKESKHIQPGLELVQKQAERLLQLINQILDLSKLDANKYQLNISTGDFVAAIKSIVWSFHSIAEIKKIDLSVNTDRDEWYINFDRENIETVLNNLLSNAFKFEPDGGVVEVTLQSNVKAPKNHLQLSIRNKGSYISPDVCALIFDRFYQSKGGALAGQGTGIGLALTRELVEFHGGNIQVESSKEQGTCFTIILPTNKPVTIQGSMPVSDKPELTNNTSDLPESVYKSTKPANAYGLPVILIIEDHEEVLTYTLSILGNDYQIETATNGKEGVDKALAMIPDLIISDVMMPEMDGIEVTNALKNNELTSHIPIILLTAKASIESRLEGLGVKADDYLTKPFISNELKVRVKNILDTRNKLKEKYSHELIIKPGNMVVKSLDEVFIEKVCKAIEGNISNESFSVEELSATIGLSRSQLHRKLEALTTKTASQFVREYRLERARELILKNAGTISEIAYLVGFSSTSYFNKCFKEYFNSTPGEIRKGIDLQTL